MVTHLAAGLATALASPASTAGTSPEEKKTAELRGYMHRYAACVVKRRHNRAAEAILSNASNGTIAKDYPDLIMPDCLGQVAPGINMRFGSDLYRYALADALVNADLISDGPVTFADRLPLAHLTSMTAEERDASAAKLKGKKKVEFLENANKEFVVAWLSRYGECIVRVDPTNTRLWLLTRPDVPEETSRINALRPAFAACLSAGEPLRFNRTTMRGAIAINYYRLAYATRQPEARN